MSDSINATTSVQRSWADKSSTMKPAPTRQGKELRDTAEGCRERAAADLNNALAMSTQNGRQVLEKSAASWTKRAEMLGRIETSIESRLAAQSLQEAALVGPERL
jgi:hypothetical protein